MRLMLVLSILLLSSMARATAPGGYVVSNQQLIGWSASGECYAVDIAGSNTYGQTLDRIEGYCGDALVEVRCVRESGECIRRDTLDDTWVAPDKLWSDRWFQQRGVKPIDAKMRDRFRDGFEVRLERGDRSCEQDCGWRWRLVERATGKMIARGALWATFGDGDRAAFVGGYLHPTKRFALLKFQFVKSSNEAARRASFTLARW